MSERDYLIAKARDWKNISHYEDKRGQGRRGARNGATVASLGATTAVVGNALTVGGDGRFGSYQGAGRNVRDLAWAERQRRASIKDSKAFINSLKPSLDKETYASEMKGLRDINRAIKRKELKAVGAIIRRNPGPTMVAGGLAGAGVGTGMWAYGRAKARHAEAQIERLRRERGTRTAAN